MTKRYGFAILLAGWLVLLSGAVKAQEAPWECRDGQGLARPVPVCSARQPCRDLLASYALLNHGMTEITQADQGIPFCGTGPLGKKHGRADYNDGAPLFVRTRTDGMQRYYCRYVPEGEGPWPVLIFMHGSGGNAGSVYDTTSLRQKADEFDLGGKGRAGFILVSLHARNLRWPTSSAQDGAKFDSYFRDFKHNPDIEYLDKVIDALVSSGKADPERIFLSGWSNGARFTVFYGLTRHHEPTPGGNRVAAVANYSGGDPFANITTDQTPGCAAAQYPKSDLPYMLVSRSCDIVACNERQYSAFLDAGVEMAPGNAAAPFIAALRHRSGDKNVRWMRINSRGKETESCMAPLFCGRFGALGNHLHWPDGVRDGSGRDHEPGMLEFLRTHPLGRAE